MTFPTSVQEIIRHGTPDAAFFLDVHHVVMTVNRGDFERILNTCCSDWYASPEEVKADIDNGKINAVQLGYGYDLKTDTCTHSVLVILETQDDV